MRKAIVFFVVLLFCFSGIASASLTDGLVANYPFNGNANDESGNGNNGTVYGATLTTDRFGNSNSAYSFDGNDYIMANNSNLPLNNAQRTISAWVLLYRTTGDNYIAGWGGPTNYQESYLNMFQDPYVQIIQDRFRFVGGGANLIGGANVQTGTWYYVSATYDGTTGRLYVNGNEVSSAVFSWTPTAIANEIFIGSNEVLSEFHQGAIDDVRIYNRALSSSEVQQLYTGNPTPVGYNPQWLMVTLASLMGAGGYMLRRKTARQ